MQDRIRIRSVETLSDDWGTLKKTTFDYRARNGVWETQTRETYDRGDGAVILPYDEARQTVLLVRQFRFPAYVVGHHEPLLEACAGLLDEAFRILSADDIRRQFGADTAWDVIEEVLVRHFNERLETSPRQRMGVAGREILHWMAQPHMLQTQRAPFEALLLSISEYAEEWLTSAQAFAGPPGEGRRPHGG